MPPRFDASPSPAQLDSFFPVESQTSPDDKLCLLGALRLVRRQGSYTYVEIGSYRGGSLTPFLMDSACTAVLSIDERGRVQPDERGVSYDYSGITNQTMLGELHRCGLATDKLATFDGSVNALEDGHAAKFDLAFIDGEHTDEACFRDFLWTLPLVKRDSIVLFHDSSLVFKALRLAILLLDKEKRPYTFFKRANSEMSALLLGKYATDKNFAHELGPAEDHAEFFARSEGMRIKAQFKNRARIRFAPQRLLKLRMPITVDIEAPTKRPAF